MRQFHISTNEHDVHIRVGRDEILVTGPDEMQVGDDYHTMHELYQHRMALTAALFHAWRDFGAAVRAVADYSYGKGNYADGVPTVGKARYHNDGTMFEGGYFVVFADTPAGQISYHYNLEHWDEFKIPGYERVPFEYDGHSSLDVLARLSQL